MLKIAEARSLAREHGFTELVTHPGGNAKLAKAKGVYNAGVSLIPSTRSGYNVCSQATPKCIEGCLAGIGRAEYLSTIQLARIARTQLLFSDRDLFFQILFTELMAIDRRAKRLGVPVAFRPNVLSDLPWHLWCREWLEEIFAHWNWYGYTKVRKYLSDVTPMHFTFSWSERTRLSDVRLLLDMGCNVAIPFFDCRTLLPTIPICDWYGFPVIDGDVSDLRYRDPRGVIVGLRAKLPKCRALAKQRILDSNGFFVGV